MHPDYYLAYNVAANAIINFGILFIPVNLQIIYGRLKNLRLCTYSEFCARRGITMLQAVMYLDSKFGAITKHPDKEQYILYYNDNMDDGPVRFTIAHELGHFFLHHLMIKSVLSYRGSPEAEYDALEKEANTFARNLLSPLPLVERALQKDYSFSIASWHISNIFKISQKASQTRIQLANYDRPLIKPAHKEYFSRIKFVGGIYCPSCTALVEDSAYCKICGNDLRLNGIVYDSVSFDKKISARYL